MALAIKNQGMSITNFEELQKRVIRRMYQEAHSTGIAPDLWKQEMQDFERAIEMGTGLKFSKVKYDTPDWEMIQNLRYNTAVYDAFKLNKQNKELYKLLTDEKGKQRSWKEFKEEAEKVTNQYNKVWLQTEFNQSHQSANQAKRWNEAVNTADLYPNLEYIAVRDDHTRPEHEKLHGAIFPIDHPFWNKNYPPNGWACRCTARPTDKALNEIEGLTFDKDDPFATNVGKTSKIFTDDHPMVKEGNKTEVLKFIARNIRTVAQIRSSFRTFGKFKKATHKQIYFDGNTGGFYVESLKHKFDPVTGKFERKTAKILAKNGHQTELLADVYGKKNIDLNLNNLPTEIKVMNGERNILNRAKTAAKQGAKRVVYYINFENEAAMFKRFESVFANVPEIKELWYIRKGKLNKYAKRNPK